MAWPAVLTWAITGIIALLPTIAQIVKDFIKGAWEVSSTVATALMHVNWKDFVTITAIIIAGWLIWVGWSNPHHDFFQVIQSTFDASSLPVGESTACNDRNLFAFWNSVTKPPVLFNMSAPWDYLVYVADSFMKLFTSFYTLLVCAFNLGKMLLFLAVLAGFMWYFWKFIATLTGVFGKQ